MNYLWFDLETSGTDTDIHCIMQAYFAVYDENLNFLEDIEILLKPDDWATARLIQDAKAKEVTGVDLFEHIKNPNTVTYSEGAIKLNELLVKYKIPNKRSHFRPCGHNIDFDRRFIFSQWIPEEEFNKLVHHNTLDTLRITTFLQDVDFLPPDLGSLTSLVEYFNIPLKDAHDARGDTQMNVDVYKALKSVIQSKKGDTVGVINNNLLKIVESI